MLHGRRPPSSSRDEKLHAQRRVTGLLPAKTVSDAGWVQNSSQRASWLPPTEDGLDADAMLAVQPKRNVSLLRLIRS